MIRTLKKSLQIDICYSVNSFIYFLRRLPIFKDLITRDAYSSKFLKRFIELLGFIFFTVRMVFLKFMYFFVIMFVCYKFFPNNLVKSFFHIYFLLTILGMFINNKQLNTNTQKYFSICLFNMDGTEYFRANLFFQLLTSTILNTIMIYFYINYLLSPPNIQYSLMLIFLTLSVRIVGEALNIIFYKKYHYVWYTNTAIYFPIVLILFGACFTPFIELFIPIKLMFVFTIIFILLSIPAMIYLIRLKDYKFIYKNLTKITNVMDKKHEKDYLRQAMVEVKEKDKKIDTKIIENKKGYDLFNTIFFERHKEILLRSARKWAGIAVVVYIGLAYLALSTPKYFTAMSTTLNKHLAIFIIIMYFINRGAIITQAMFFNCDHAMLRFNFFREPKVLLELFKKRLITVIKVNLIPAFVIGIGNIFLLLLTNNYNILILITTFLFIILLSIFFSVHYLVIYYLLQPFNKDMEVKKASYSIVNLLMYIVTYQLMDLVLDSLKLSVIGIIFCSVYIGLSLLLVYKVAPRTFKLN